VCFYDAKLDYTIGAPMSNNKEVQRLFERNKQKLRSFNSMVVYNNVTSYHVSDFKNRWHALFLYRKKAFRIYKDYAVPEFHLETDDLLGLRHSRRKQAY